jgi:1-deoxy-D-xylulose-5-phosphate synthase
VVFMLDRAGLTGPDGPTHHGAFDLGYLRLFPNMTVLAPGDEHDLAAMLDWSLAHNGPVAIRYPKAVVECQPAPRTPIELGRAEVLLEGHDGLIIACGTLVGAAFDAVTRLREEGLTVGLVNARFVKPLDARLPVWVEAAPWVVTVEENALQTGFGSAVLEAVSDAGVHGVPIVRLGLPDRFVEHGERGELLADLGLDAAGIAAACRRLAGREPHANAAVTLARSAAEDAAHR